MAQSGSGKKDYDANFAYDEVAVKQHAKEKPWETDPKYYNRVEVSALAAMKMLKHALQGVAEGRSEKGVTNEVMGLMIGKPEGRTIIVSDVYPLPVKGAENDVKMTEKASIFMTQIVDALEVRRKDRFMGWYHSHPFDMEAWSHCHLSSTDVGSQTVWQYSTKWWTAIVIDPLRSLYKQAPEFGAYQIYHTKNYNCPKNVCPDGTIMNDEKARLQRWGISSNLYYELPISYYSSSLSSHLVNIISKSALWIKVLSSTPQRDLENIAAFVKQLNKSNGAINEAKALIGRPSGTALGPSARGRVPALDSALDSVASQAVGECSCQCTQVLKAILFNLSEREAEKERKAAAAAAAGAGVSSSSSAGAGVEKKE